MKKWKNEAVATYPLRPYNPTLPNNATKQKRLAKTSRSNGVANAAWTRDLLNHNQMLYRLSYSHHVHETYRITQQRNTIHEFSDLRQHHLFRRVVMYFIFIILIFVLWRFEIFRTDCMFACLWSFAIANKEIPQNSHHSTMANATMSVWVFLSTINAFLA